MRQRFWLTIIFVLIVTAFLAFFGLLQTSLITGSGVLNEHRNEIAIATVCFTAFFTGILLTTILYLVLTHRLYGRFSYLAKRMLWFGLVLVVLSLIALGLSASNLDSRDYQAWASGLNLVLSAFFSYQMSRFIFQLWFPA